MKTRLLAALAVLPVMMAAGCRSPKYVHRYRSVLKDFTVSAPWDWDVIAEAQKGNFSEVRFIGPSDPDFFLGEPSLSVRWYKRNRPHRLADGSMEMYADADDFILQTLSQLYRYRFGDDKERTILYGAGQREDGGREILAGPADIPTITLKESGLQAKYFIVLSPTPAPPNSRQGVDVGPDGAAYNMRMHAYAVVPMQGGFYVLCYPATRRGFDRYEDRFRVLVNTFHPLTAGPGGAKVLLRPAAARG